MRGPGLICELEAIPDLTPLLKPTTVGDFATYCFASAGGLFLGGELGRMAHRSFYDKNAN
jgi:hypothetical protein